MDHSRFWPREVDPPKINGMPLGLQFLGAVTTQTPAEMATRIHSELSRMVSLLVAAGADPRELVLNHTFRFEGNVFVEQYWYGLRAP
jgi:hypothetical protein